ncbi:MAG: polymer-forming cytoskeletal protein [Amaricoccus sp.]|uniref:bactofilin family protein n=1 Tax=Amaricoccus sp. TaxID=1872485 RepID=UPI0039E29C9D
MFTKPKPETKPEEPRATAPIIEPVSFASPIERQAPAPVAAAPKPKPAASILSSDITITGNVRSSGDIQIEGTVEGDIRAHTLVVGEGATVKGEVMAEDVVVHGRVVGRLRGLKVRLSQSARCEGDIVHKTIAIESGAHFEGSVQRQEDPLGKGKDAPLRGVAQGAELASA